MVCFYNTNNSKRLYPTLYALPRFPIRDCEISGYTFPAECFMIVSPWVMQRSSSYFANPEQFQPERKEMRVIVIQSSNSRSVAIDHQQLLPIVSISVCKTRDSSRVTC